MGDDDDWFERALRDDDAEDAPADRRETPGDDGETPDGPDADVDEGDSADAETEDVGSGDGAATDAESDAFADERAPDDADDSASDSDPFGGVRDGSSEPTGDDAGRRPSADPEFGDDAADAGGDTGGPGEDDWNDFGSAPEDAPGPDGGGSGIPGPFGTESGGGSGAGVGDFEAAGPPRGGPEEFDEEDFESEIDRLDVGVDGLDEMILGGVPTRSLMVAIGSAGTGKTTLGLQFLNHALEAGDSAVFITLEESRERILDTAAEKGWSFREYESEERLAIVDLDPVEMANSLESIRNDLPRLVREFGADRLVLDSVSLLEMMYDRPSKRRTRVFNFARSLKDAGVTTMLTSEASEDNPYVSRHGIVEYLADAVFVMQYVRPDDFRETRLAIEIQKIRDANHSRETKPYELTNDGISVYGRANIF